MFYLTSARSLLSGYGLQWVGGGGVLKPLVHYPPLYPMSLALLGKLGLTLIDAARWFAALLFGLNAILGGWLVYRNVSRARWAPIVTTGLLVASPSMVDNHLEALSEPLFYMFLLLTWVLVTDYLERPRSWLILAAGLTTAMAALTRYVGPALVASIVLGLLVIDRRPLRYRMRAASVYLTAALGPMLLWFLRNYLETGSAANRLLVYHRIVKHDLFDVVRTAVAWLAPEDLPWRIQELVFLTAAVAFVGLVVGFLRLQVARCDSDALTKRAVRLPVLLLAFAVCYAGLLAVSKTLLDASTQFTDRILSPLYFVLILTVIAIAADRASARTSLAIRALAAGLAILLLGSYLYRSLGLLSDMRLEGREFTGKTWRTSDGIAWLRGMPQDTLVYSNEAGPILFLTGIPAMDIPERIDTVQQRARPDYLTNLQKMRSGLQVDKGLLVVFPRSYAIRPEYPSLDELAAGLTVRTRTDDAIIYASP